CEILFTVLFRYLVSTRYYTRLLEISGFQYSTFIATQGRFGRKLKVIVQTIDLNGRNDIPDAISARGMAEALGVTVEYLMRGNDDINAKTECTEHLSGNPPQKRLGNWP
ncbi:MAG: hypothetical protein LBH42_07905, partial [Treponema sp.]|nr:hypothetical protein [Treponema sp.]